MCKGEFAKKLDAQAFPGVQGGPLMHAIAAKAVCLHEALQPSFEDYAHQIVNNAKALAARLFHARLSHCVRRHRQPPDAGRSASSRSHGRRCPNGARSRGDYRQQERDPFDTEPISKTGGIRVGTPAMTTRGLKKRR